MAFTYTVKIKTIIATIIKCDLIKGRKGRIYFLLAFKSRFTVIAIISHIVAPPCDKHHVEREGIAKVGIPAGNNYVRTVIILSASLGGEHRSYPE